jgi:large subunit ribosomal protein L11
MAKKIKTVIKLQLPAGKATPAPPVGTALGPHGLNIAQFVKEFNDKTAPMGDTVIPVEMTIFEDRTYTFILKTPPAANLIMKAIGLQKGSANPLRPK